MSSPWIPPEVGDDVVPGSDGGSDTDTGTRTSSGSVSEVGVPWKTSNATGTQGRVSSLLRADLGAPNDTLVGHTGRHPSSSLSISCRVFRSSLSDLLLRSPPPAVTGETQEKDSSSTCVPPSPLSSLLFPLTLPLPSRTVF